MALWGNLDAVGNSAGTVSVNYATKVVTGASGANFVTAGISTGDVISIGVGNTFGEAVVSLVTDATTLSIASTQFLSGQAIAGVAYTVSQKPVYTLHDTNYGASEIYGVDFVEVGIAATTPYAVTHSGWVGLTTYTDMHGNLRVKHEVLVASGILSTADAGDDDKFAYS